ncbi:MAG: MFS transporter [Spongiibacteraceae bacterium]|nr:MFS transporter [Spongiibacteraceae bacterium]
MNSTTKQSADYEALQTQLNNCVANSPMTTIQVVVVALCFILNMIDGMDVLVVSFTGSEILTEWGLSKSAMGYIYSAGLAGMTLGCLFLAPLADKLGRKNLLLLSTAIITIGMLLSALVNSYSQLLIIRVLTGLGIGGILPTMAALAAEFSSDKRRNLSVGFVQAGWPIGAIFTGFFVAWAVPEFGWRSAYLTAGIISAIMLPVIFFIMPESLAFLGKHQPPNALQRINKLLKKMGHASIDSLPKAPEKIAPPTFRDLFSPSLAASTLRLWLGIFFGFMTLYTLISWVPSIAKESGMPFEMATYVGTALNIGAFCGSVLLGWLSVRFGLKKLILIFMLSAFAIMSAYGSFNLTYTLMFVTTFFIGVTVQGGFNGFYPAATRIYPAALRATGIGMAVGVGRFGAILGPALFGILLDTGMSISTLFIIFSLPLVIAGFAAYSIPSKDLH